MDWLGDKLEAYAQHIQRVRDEPPGHPKLPPSVYQVRFNIRSQTPDGNAVPDDEVQLDFCISNGERDAHGSYMDEKTLRNYGAEAAAGVPFMLNHSEGLMHQLGRTIAGTYDESQKRVVATMSMLRDTDNTPENMKVDEYIRRIERGYYTDCSVGFQEGREICRLDGKDIWDYAADDPCTHIPLRVYNGKVCEYDVVDAHLREVSLVFSGSNPGSKKLDTRSWPEDMRRVKADGSQTESQDPKTLLEKDGLKYRESLITKALEEGVRAMETFDENVWRTRFTTMDADTIIDQTATWTELGDQKWGKGERQTSPEAASGSGGGGENVLILPSNLFIS